MSLLAAMRGASDGELLVAEAKGVGGAALNQRQRLHGLDGGARIDRALDVADAKQHAPIVIGDGDGAAVAALHQASAHHLDQNRIVLHRFPLIGIAQEEHHGRARSPTASFAVAGMISMGTPGSRFDARITREVLTLATSGGAVSSWMNNPENAVRSGDAFQHEVDLARKHIAIAHDGRAAHALFEGDEVGLGLAVQPDHGKGGDVVAERRSSSRAA